MKRFFCFIVSAFFCFSAFSKVYINIGAPQNVKKSVIALSPFVFSGEGGASQANLGPEMTERLKKNLDFSSYFNVLSPKAFIEDPSTTAPVPYPQSLKGFRWENWKLTGADFLLFASYSVSQEEIVSDIYFYNISLQKLLFKKTYRKPKSQVLKIVDELSNDIVKKLSGREGIFETKIVSVRNTGGSKKELFVMDWNGQNKRRLTYHRSIVLSPSWSHKGDKLAYSAFVYNKKLQKRVVGLFLYDFQTNKIKLISDKSGATLGSNFFPGDRKILVTLGFGKGYMSIFKMDLKSKNLTSISQVIPNVINVEPSIHPITGKIAFSSDRSGKTMIYTMDSSGANVQRLTFAGNHNASPVWHPFKRELIFSGLSNGRMDLFQVNSQGRGLKRLSSLKKKNGRWANCESPSYSPDGRFVVFSSDVSGSYQLYVMNLDDLSIERITFDRYNYKSPKWSPYL